MIPLGRPTAYLVLALALVGGVIAYGEWRASQARSHAEAERLRDYKDTTEAIDAVDTDADDDGVAEWLRDRASRLLGGVLPED